MLLWHWWGDLNVRVWGSLWLIMAMTTVPPLEFAEGMPSMEVVKLWQSLPNEGHPMLLSLKTMEWINLCRVFVYLISDIFIHQNLAQIYTYYTLHWVTPGHRPKSSSKFPWKSQAASERSGIAKVDERGGSILCGSGCCLQSPLNNGPVISMRILSSENWKKIRIRLPKIDTPAVLRWLAFRGFRWVLWRWRLRVDCCWSSGSLPVSTVVGNAQRDTDHQWRKVI